MFYYLLLTNFLIAVAVSFIVVSLFSKSIDKILNRIINDPINSTWAKYTKFAGLVVGISSGIRIYEMEKYITPLINTKDNNYVIELTSQRWVLEIFRTIIETLQGLAWMLFVFFVIALISYVLVRMSELKYKNKD